MKIEFLGSLRLRSLDWWISRARMYLFILENSKKGSKWDALKGRSCEEWWWMVNNGFEYDDYTLPNSVT